MASVGIQLVYCGVSWNAVWDEEAECGNLVLLSQAVCCYILVSAGAVVVVNSVQVWFAVRRVRKERV